MIHAETTSRGIELQFKGERLPLYEELNALIKSALDCPDMRKAVISSLASYNDLGGVINELDGLIQSIKPDSRN